MAEAWTVGVGEEDGSAMERWERNGDKHVELIVRTIELNEWAEWLRS